MRKKDKLRICAYCETEFYAEIHPIKKGEAKYCSPYCYQQSKKLGFGRRYVGKEKACLVFQKSRRNYSVYWYDPETLERKGTTYPRWFWEMNYGEVPEGFYPTYKDGNGMNLNADNIVLKPVEEMGKAKNIWMFMNGGNSD